MDQHAPRPLGLAKGPFDLPCGVSFGLSGDRRTERGGHIALKCICCYGLGKRRRRPTPAL